MHFLEDKRIFEKRFKTYREGVKYPSVDPTLGQTQTVNFVPGKLFNLKEILPATLNRAATSKSGELCPELISFASPSHFLDCHRISRPAASLLRNAPFSLLSSWKKDYNNSNSNNEDWTTTAAIFWRTKGASLFLKKRFHFSSTTRTNGPKDTWSTSNAEK